MSSTPIVTTNDRPCNILFVHRGGNWIRGSERVLIDLLTGLDRRQYCPVLWCNKSILAETLSKTDIAVHTSATEVPFHPRGRLGSLSSAWSQFRRAIQYISQHKIDIIHCNNPESMQWMVPAARYAKVPLLCHLHMIYGAWARCVYLMHKSDFVVGCSNAVIEGLMEDKYPEKLLKVIYNGVPAASGENKTPKGQGKAALDLPEDGTVLAVIGSIEHLKGFDIAVEALRILQRKGRNTHLLVIGQGKDRGTLERQINNADLNDFVHFLGQMKRDDIFRILETAVDLTIVPSRYEAFSLVAIESQAVGVPVIGADIGGISEAIEHEKTGLLVPPEDPQMMAEAVELLMKSSEKRSQMGQQGRLSAKMRFSTQGMISEFTEVYEVLYGQGQLLKRQKTIPFMCFRALLKAGRAGLGNRDIRISGVSA